MTDNSETILAQLGVEELAPRPTEVKDRDSGGQTDCGDDDALERNILRLVRKSRLRSSQPPWLDRTIRDGRGGVESNLANISLALREAPELRDAFSYDEMQCATILNQELPRADGVEASTDAFPRPMRDGDVTRAQEWLQWQGMPRITRDATHQAIIARAQERAFNPVRQYLEPLVWDGAPRLDSWLSVYLGAAPSPYHAAVGRMALIAAVARVFEPGCKLDYAMVLEGPQGAGKSRACQIIGGKWFSDSLPDIGHDKETAQHLRGKWVIEISELAATRRAESEALKAFISRRVERYRPPYGREEVYEPRRCIFIATTNRDTYLKDETGGRRFWPVRVGKIDIEALARDRDQLFAEAVSRYRAGERWWPDPAFERLHIEAEQEARFEVDPWEEIIAEYLAEGRAPVRINEIAEHALGLDKSKIGRLEQLRIIGIMKRLGYVAGKRDNKGQKYFPSAKAGQLPEEVSQADAGAVLALNRLEDDREAERRMFESIFSNAASEPTK